MNDNPINTIKNMLGSMSPKNIAMNMIKKNSNPMINNLIQMAESGNTKELEKVANNLFKEQGKDFNKEFTNFMNNFK